METDLDRVGTELSEIHERPLALPVRAIDVGAGLEDVEARIRQILEQMRSSR